MENNFGCVICYLKEALTEVSHWLDQHIKEVVIIALSAFDGMNLDQHRDLIQFLISTFNNKICPNHVSMFMFLPSKKHLSKNLSKNFYT